MAFSTPLDAAGDDGTATSLVPVRVPEPSKPEPVPETVELVFVGPFYVASFVTEDADGNTLTFTRNGTAVLADDADQIIADAAAVGSSLTRKVN